MRRYRHVGCKDRPTTGPQNGLAFFIKITTEPTPRGSATHGEPHGWSDQAPLQQRRYPLPQLPLWPRYRAFALDLNDVLECLRRRIAQVSPKTRTYSGRSGTHLISSRASRRLPDKALGEVFAL